MNRLEQAVNATGEAAAYQYNGLGHRVGKTTGTARLQMEEASQLPDPMESLKQHTLDPEKDIRYTIDLTRGYHNLLQKEEGGTTQTYQWDGNVAAMKEQTGTGKGLPDGM